MPVEGLEQFVVTARDMEALSESSQREVDIVLLSQGYLPSQPLGRIRCSVAVRAGARDVLPLALGLVPLGLVVGAGVRESSVPNIVGWLGSVFIFGGSAQLAAVTLLGAGAGAFAAIAAALTANARCSMYSAALASDLQTQPRWFRWAAPYFLADPVYAVMAERVTKEKRPAWLRHYYLAAGAVVWVVWQTTVAVGIVVGDALVERLPLDVAVAALFIGVLVPGITTRVAVIAAITALLVAGAGAGLPNGLGLVAGAAAGVLVATAVERRLS